MSIKSRSHQSLLLKDDAMVLVILDVNVKADAVAHEAVLEEGDGGAQHEGEEEVDVHRVPRTVQFPVDKSV